MTFLHSADIERVTRARRWVRGTRCEFRSERSFVPLVADAVDVLCTTHADLAFASWTSTALRREEPFDFDTWFAGPSYYRAAPCEKGSS